MANTMSFLNALSGNRKITRANFSFFTFCLEHGNMVLICDCYIRNRCEKGTTPECGNSKTVSSRPKSALLLSKKNQGK